MFWKIWILQFVLIFNCFQYVYAKETFSASVKKIIDGDSLVVSASGKSLEIRLYGIDSPEYDQPFSREAKKFAKTNILGQKVKIQPLYHDSYGRLVAIVFSGDAVWNRELVRAGLAWVSPRYCKKAVCSSWKESERVAQKEKEGLWHDSRPDPPWVWKKMKAGR